MNTHGERRHDPDHRSPYPTDLPWTAGDTDVIAELRISHYTPRIQIRRRGSAQVRSVSEARTAVGSPSRGQEKSHWSWSRRITTMLTKVAT